MRGTGEPKLIPADSVARALVRIGDRWSLLIIGSAFVGVRRFDEWRQSIGIASNILSNRLTRLVAIGCFEKIPDANSNRSVYVLTVMGRELFPIVLMFWRFDRLWSPVRPIRSDSLVHSRCDQTMTPVLVCGRCLGAIVARNVQFSDGPGAGMEGNPPPKSSRRSNVTLSDAARINVVFGDSIDLIGDRWTQLVLASFFLGDRRYEEIRARWHIATNVLADRLRLLVDRGVLQRRIYQGSPERSEYLLTPKGMDVYPIVLTLMKWGDRWLTPKGDRPLLLTHTPCGSELDPIVVCDRCGEALDSDTVTFKARKGEAAKPAP